MWTQLIALFQIHILSYLGNLHLSRMFDVWHIAAETKRSPFRRLHFQINFRVVYGIRCILSEGPMNIN